MALQQSPNIADAGRLCEPGTLVFSGGFTDWKPYDPQIVADVDQLFRHHRSQCNHRSNEVSAQYQEELAKKCNFILKYIVKYDDVSINGDMFEVIDRLFKYHQAIVTEMRGPSKEWSEVFVGELKKLSEMIEKVNEDIILGNVPQSEYYTGTIANPKSVPSDEHRAHALINWLELHEEDFDICKDGVEYTSSLNDAPTEFFCTDNLGEYVVLTREEADALALSYLSEDAFEDFNIELFNAINDLHPDIQKFVQVDRKGWAKWVIDIDGCGPTLNPWDGNEYETEIDFNGDCNYRLFIYRIN